MGKILLCDDEDSLCRSLGRILRAAGHEVVAVDGIGGHKLLQQREQWFDLILTDIRMPGVSGFEILSAARTHAPGTPVIAMSGSAEIPDAVRAMHAGARDFLIKPFETRTLEEAVAAVLKPPTPMQPQTDALGWRVQTHEEFAKDQFSVGIRQIEKDWWHGRCNGPEEARATGQLVEAGYLRKHKE